MTKYKYFKTKEELIDAFCEVWKRNCMPWEEFEVMTPDNRWRKQSTLSSFIFSPTQYRQIIPTKTRVLNGVEVAAPLSEAPRVGSECYYISTYDIDPVAPHNWLDDSVDRRLLGRGIVFATEDDARENAEVLLDMLRAGE